MIPATGMVGLLRVLIYLLAALALYRLWPDHGFLWWALLASAILNGLDHGHREDRSRRIGLAL